MKKEKVEKTRYITNCPICKEQITGNGESQAEYNLKVHIWAKHPEKGK